MSTFILTFELGLPLSVSIYCISVFLSFFTPLLLLVVNLGDGMYPEYARCIFAGTEQWPKWINNLELYWSHDSNIMLTPTIRVKSFTSCCCLIKFWSLFLSADPGRNILEVLLTLHQLLCQCVSSDFEGWYFHSCFLQALFN